MELNIINRFLVESSLTTNDLTQEEMETDVKLSVQVSLEKIEKRSEISINFNVFFKKDNILSIKEKFFIEYESNQTFDDLEDQEKSQKLFKHFFNTLYKKRLEKEIQLTGIDGIEIPNV